MDSKNNKTVENQLLESLSIVELEERHEMTMVGAELGRCNSKEKADKISE